MRLIHDYIHAFRGPSGARSACRLGLYLPDEEDKILDDAPVGELARKRAASDGESH